MSDPTPKLRVVDDEAEKSGDVVRLRAKGTSFEPVERLPGPSPHEVAERLEIQTRETFEGRSQEPGVEAILDQEEVTEGVENPWGMRDGRLAGVPYGWFVLIVLLLVGAGVWAGLAMRQGEKQADRHLQTARVAVEDDEAANRAARRLVERVEHVVRGYLGATTVAEVLPYVRHPDRMKPLIEAEWQARPPKPLEFRSLAMFVPATIPGATFWIVRADVRKGEPQNLLVEQTGDAEVRIDWETHVCHQPMDWNRYIAERPSDRALDFRVWAEPATFYSHEFSNSGRWRAYRLTTRDSDDYLFGYVAFDSAVAKELEACAAGVPEGGMATAILRLRFPSGGGAPRGVVIEKVVEPRWLYVKEPAADAP